MKLLIGEDSPVASDDWTRHVTNTEYVVERLRQRVPFYMPATHENATVYRLQPKIVADEKRVALALVGRYGGGENFCGIWAGRHFEGIDFLTPVAELAKAPTIVLKRVSNDPYLWLSAH